MNTETDLYSSPVSSPVSSPNPTTQEVSTCLTRQKAQEEIEFLSILMENTATILNAYKNKRFFDENDFSYKAEMSRYREANKIINKYSFAQAVSNAPRTQIGPLSGSKTSTQNEARPIKNNRLNPNYSHNQQEEKFSHSIDLLLVLADILKIGNRKKPQKIIGIRLIFNWRFKMSLRFECKSEGKTRIPSSRNAFSRNSLQNDNPLSKCRRSSSVDSRARGSGGMPLKPRSTSEERKSLFHSSRKSSINFNECKTLKEQRPLADKAYQKKKILELLEYLNETSFKSQISASKLLQPSKKDFEIIFQHLAQFFETDYVVKKIEEEAPRILKSLCYPFIPTKSAFVYIARTNWPTLLGCLLFLMDMAKFAESIDTKLFFNTAENENPQEHAYLNETSFKSQISASKLLQPSKKDFEIIFQHLAQFFETDYVVKKIEEEAPRILKSLCYPFIPTKSAFVYIARTNWPTLLGCLLFLMDMAKFAESIDTKLFFNTAENENPQEHAILLNYIFTSYISKDDEEEEINFFTQLIKSRNPYDIEYLRGQNEGLKLALEQVKTEVEEINDLKANSEQHDVIAKQYENYFSQMKDHRQKKEIMCEKLSKELAEKEAELQNLKDILAQKQASFDAQGFDGKKQMSYYDSQKKELSEKLQLKNSGFKKLQSECWDAEMQYAKDLDKGTSTCETFNELYSNVNEITINIIDTLRNARDPNIKNLCSNFTFDFPDCKMQLVQKSILQQSNTCKSALEEMKKKIDATDLFLNCLATKENEKLQEIMIKKSDVSVKIKVTSSQETKKERGLNAEEKQALEEVKALEIECDEMLKVLERVRAETVMSENKNALFIEEYKELQEVKKKKKRILDNYFSEQKKLFIHHSKVFNNTKREIDESGELICAIISKKLEKEDM
ncbi:putative kinetochore protein NDC80 [Nephila pilipes]|uniref:Putative kinetochore protein NDC80 n=1 Tax=Nephila pilipes TaxID=299642 RepID=A0A8X6P158_NEPPI|nr:putative kinetochore protein NDC80 [Nephila pilipes]